ncbi:cytidine deaminase [Tuanshanicoccus lijuaniae]|uniref:cytidine deaminase n=1 Tax=Aerococcaceae bacterium zg-1292 TaxID=2774330 RepID=UPI001BD87FFB|nr:cytidine deaminase [Aerococcaceae bacterium zg-BR22]MBS4455586.1 cytidine deaminase [Aerococcaceae bacterium zg-A91]MBS4457205.1 cytidine deaminase [Aerococcaceae bacterium zg-BR33]
MNKEQLMERAVKVMEKSYSPYSHFPVGCAMLMKDGEVIEGVNVENVSFGATNCAERTAIFTAVTKGYAPKSIAAIAVSGDTEAFLPPCSICRQVLVEFCDAETPVYLTRHDGAIFETSVKELVPFAFETLEM